MPSFVELKSRTRKVQGKVGCGDLGLKVIQHCGGGVEEIVGQG